MTKKIGEIKKAVVEKEKAVAQKVKVTVKKEAQVIKQVVEKEIEAAKHYQPNWHFISTSALLLGLIVCLIGIGYSLHWWH